jgi:glutamine cyclotransferase
MQRHQITHSLDCAAFPSADIIGVETDDKEERERSYPISASPSVEVIVVETDDKEETKQSAPISPKFRVNMTDGIMYQTIGDQMPHDKTHFTQGLTYSKHSDMLFESNGLYGVSNVCKIDPYTGKEILCVKMETKYFAEGLQVYGNPGDEKLIQITWKSRDGFIYDAETLKLEKTFRFSTTRNQGWGICYDENKNEFIVSDGSPYLHFWDVDSLEEKRKVLVTRQNGKAAKEINELEFVNGVVLANVWYEDVILVIDPISGECLSEYGEFICYYKL